MKSNHTAAASGAYEVHYDGRYFHRREKAEPGSYLAQARIAAHAAFDPIWRSGKMSRSAAYRWLAKQLDIPEQYCHMQMLTEASCKRVAEICAPKRAEIEQAEWKALAQ